MTNTLSKVLIFTAGAAIGSVVTWKLVKTKYERIAQEEIDSVKEVYSRRAETVSDEIFEEFEDVFVKKDEPVEEVKEAVHATVTNLKPDIMEYAEKLRKEGYGIDYSMKSKNDEPKKELMDYQERPYSIPPEEYGEYDDYEEVSLIYYADEYLADEMDYLVEDIDATVGGDFANYIGEFEDDVAYIRNDKLKCDYEICISLQNYTDIVPDHPRGVEEE